ncbi:hypothetical protein J132_09094 [Termitomyces sp. J132]|nr:hypothetical protein J132_09094 [Termitomyces sp. J132]
MTDVTGFEPSNGTSTSSNPTMMPTEIVDAAELQAGGNDDSPANVSFGNSSLTSSVSDGDDHRDASTIERDVIVDQYITDSAAIKHKEMREQFETTPTEGLNEAIEKARNNMSQTEREYVDRRMERVAFSNNDTNAGETSQSKGKTIDPRNWGGINLDEPEMDPEFQQDLLTEFNSRRNLETPPPTQSPEPNALTADVRDIAGGDAQRSEEVEGEDAQREVSREEVLDYLRNKKKLAREMDRRNKKRKMSHNRRKDRAGSEPLSNKLAALIQKVADGSRHKTRYKPDSREKRTKSDLMAATKPITQITSKSALGRAFERLGKRQRPNQIRKRALNIAASPVTPAHQVA